MSTPAAWRGERAVSPRLDLVLEVAHRLVALVLLVLLLPVMVGVALLVLVTSGGPVFYRQVRIGQFGRPFRIVKFRTMDAGTDAWLPAVLAARGIDLGPFCKVRNDPRVTRVGRWLRRTSLDELPQLFNVVVGDMRLVGPRPQSPAEVSTYDDLVWRRLLVRPGVTGMWQVHGRSDLTADEGLALDLEYVREWTPGLDVRLLAKTPLAVMAQRGAY